MIIKEFADKIEVRPAERVKWLFLRGKVVDFKSEIGFEDMREFAEQYGFIVRKKDNVWQQIDKHHAHIFFLDVCALKQGKQLYQTAKSVMNMNL